MRNKIAEFGFAIYYNNGQIDVVFKKAKKVPKAYDSFVATLELACLAQTQQFLNKVGKEDKNGKSGI